MRLAMRVAACALPILCAAVSFGLLRATDAPAVSSVLLSRASGVWNPGPADFDLWTYVFGRLLVAVPLADVPTRLGLVSAFFSSIAIGIWVCVGLQVTSLVQRVPLARLAGKDQLAEPVAVVGAVATLAFCIPVFGLGTLPGGGGVALAVVAGWMWAASLLLQDPTRPQPALALAVLAGLATATSPPLAVLLFPPTFAIWLWGLGRSARWALLLPLAFFTGASLLVASAAWGQGPLATFNGWWNALTLRPLLDAMEAVDAQKWWNAASALADHVGVVAVLLIVAGLAVLTLRRPGVAAVVLYCLWATMMMVAGASETVNGSTLPAGHAWALGAWIGMAVVPLVAGILQFASKLGRAKLPATIALCVMGAVAPMLSGGISRYLPDGRMSMRLLTRAQWNVAPRSVVDPGSAPMSMTFEYGRALGLRSDLRPAPPKPREHR